MHLLHRFVSSTLCCFSTHQEDALERPAILRDLPNNLSNVSMTMPAASIPNVASTSEELRKIFASDATPGGYNAAANGPTKRLPLHGSLDLSFQFGSVEQPKKSVEQVEQVTHHIKQKLSEGRLSKRSSGDRVSDPESNRRTSTRRAAADESTELLGVSQRSTGLTDLLTSRAGSEGGYDSDARSIQTPMLRSNAGTFKNSPAFVRKSLKTILSESNQESLELQMRGNKDEALATSSSRRVESKSSPLPMTPAKVSFTEAMQIAPGESPSDALRRLSTGIANGTIKIPTTPELRALRSPSTNEVESEWKSTVRTPQGASSLSKDDFETDTTIKRLSDRIADARRQSSKASSSRGQHDSLISELDPALLEYIERYARGDYSEWYSLVSSPTTAIKIQDKDMAEDRHNSQRQLDSITQSLASSTHDLSSLSDSAGQSIHLFNMRISQRLASNSRVPMLSSPNSNNASARSLTTQPDSDLVHQSSTSVSRYPSFVTTERNCCPSDPATRGKFEKIQKPQTNSVDQKMVNLKQNYLTVNEDSQQLRIHDNASSVYGSDFNEQRSASGFSLPTSRRSSLRNPNSLAIGGRSVSDAPPRRTRTDESITRSTHDHPCRQDTLDRLQETEDDADATPIKARSFSLPVKRKLSVKSKLLSQQAVDTTEDNEQMSEISIGVVCSKHNKILSEAEPEPALFEILAPTDDTQRQADEDGVTQDNLPEEKDLSARKELNKSRYRLPVLSEYGQRISIESPSERPMAVLKRRVARQQVQKLEPLILPQPPLNSMRDDAFIESINDTGIPVIAFETVSRKRSQSIDDIRPPVPTPATKDKLHRKSLPVLNLVSTGPVSNKAQTWIDKGKLKKRSILDVGRRFTAANIFHEDKKDQFRSKAENTSSIWSGFPSHTREQRNGAAAIINGVQARDFTHEEYVVDVDSPLATQSILSSQSRTPTSRRFLSMAETRPNRNKTKSLNFHLSLEERAKRNRRGLVGRFRRLYRSSSSDLKAFTNTHGRRGSVSLERHLEYPELECFPAERLFVTSQNNNQQPGNKDLDGADDRNVELNDLPFSQSEYSNQTSTDVNSTDWVDLYTDCVGSLSALRSSSELHQKSLPQLGSIVRDSTEGFENNLVRDAAEAKARLLLQVQKSNSSASRRLHDRLSIELKIPGSFD